MTDSRVRVDFFVDNRRYAGRFWTSVPRVGDEVMLGPDDDRKCFKVKRVVWGNETDSNPQLVNIELRKARA